MQSESTLIELVRRVLGCDPQEMAVPVEWTEVQELALRHRVAPLLNTLPPRDIPSDVKGLFQAVAFESAQRSIQAKRTLARLHEFFKDDGIRALLFKGIALQEWAYGSLVRACGDIDLLIEPEKLGAVAQKLKELGFQKEADACGSTAAYSQIGVWRDAYGNIIDLHTTALEPYVYAFPCFSELWEGRQELASVAFPILGPAHHMLLVLLHGSKHQWCRLSWIVDVAVASRRLEMHDWQRVYQIGQRNNYVRAVVVGLLLCQEFVAIQDKSLKRLVHVDYPDAQEIAEIYRTRLFKPFRNTPRVKLVNSLLHLRTMEGLGPRARYILGRLGKRIRVYAPGSEYAN